MKNHPALHWRLRKQRYRLVTAICPACGRRLTGCAKLLDRYNRTDFSDLQLIIPTKVEDFIPQSGYS